MFYQILYNKFENINSLIQYYDAFKYSKKFKDIKSFYTYNNFFKMFIEANLIKLFIIFAGYNNINIYKKI